jgi:hypothetical protein
LGCVSEFGGHGKHTRVRRGRQLAHEGLCGGLVAVDDHWRGAFVHKCAHDRGADTAGAAGHQHNLVGEI